MGVTERFDGRGAEPERMTDEDFLSRAIEMALEAEARGNLPIGAVVTLDGRVVAAAGNGSLAPPHPGRHAEMLALAAIPEELLPRLSEMTCYTTLEPCVMCFGALVLHRIGRVVFGAKDPRGGALALLEHLPRDVRGEIAHVEWIGPLRPDLCDPLYARAAARYWGLR